MRHILTTLIRCAPLALAAVALGACHSGGSYFSMSPAKPKGPGVVECGWYHNDENTFVGEYCPPSSAAYTALAGQLGNGYMSGGRFETKWDGIDTNCTDCSGTSRYVEMSATAPAMRIAAAPVTAPFAAQSSSDVAARLAATRSKSSSIDMSAPSRLIPQRTTAVVTTATRAGEGWTVMPAIESRIDDRAVRTVEVIKAPAIRTGDAIVIEEWDAPLPPPKPGQPMEIPGRFTSR